MNKQPNRDCYYLISKRYKELYNSFQKLNKFCLLDCDSSTFADGEVRFRLNADQIDNNTIIRIIHPLIDDTSVLELIFMLDAVNRYPFVETPNRPSLDKMIQLVIPYMRYSRQNRRVDGEPMSANCIIKMILSHSEKLQSIEFFDLHDEGLLNLIPSSINTFNIDSDSLFHLIFCTHIDDIVNTVVIAPDIGAVKRARNFANIIKSNFDIAIIDKTRNQDGKSQINNIVGQDVTDKACIIRDDIVDSAGTLCQAAKLLKEKGAKKVYACITHGVFSVGATQRIEDSDIDKLYVTDSNKFDINLKYSTKIEVIPFLVHEAYNPLISLSELLEIYDTLKDNEIMATGIA